MVEMILAAGVNATSHHGTEADVWQLVERVSFCRVRQLLFPPRDLCDPIRIDRRPVACIQRGDGGHRLGLRGLVRHLARSSNALNRRDAAAQSCWSSDFGQSEISHC